jgi:BirA family biotin operon repressor/biotin-[acetyl-CoA-carboxylase] ligase
MLDDSASTAASRFSDVRWFETVDSTNSVASDLVRREGAMPGIVVVADHQRAGRGRRGRRWEAPPGSSLLVSVVLPPAAADRAAHFTTIALALAASDACDEVAGVRPLLKWPNDLLVDGRKLGGILGEANEGCIIAGLGLNVNWGGASPPASGVSLDALAGGPVDRRLLLAAVLRRFDHHLAATVEQLLDDYRAHSATLGCRVRVKLAGDTIEGEAVAITAHGHLLVDDGERHVIAAGDIVHLRPAGPDRPHKFVRP